MASRSMNRVILIGNLTRDPELKYTPSGTAVCTIGVATNRSWTTNDGQQKDEVQYHRIVAWQKLAELCGKLLAKGRKVYLEGRLTYRSYTDKTGVQRSITEIVMDDFIVFGDGRKMTDANGTSNQDKAINQPAETIEKPIKEEVKSEETKKEDTSSEDVNPEDIPF